MLFKFLCMQFDFLVILKLFKFGESHLLSIGIVDLFFFILRSCNTKNFIQNTKFSYLHFINWRLSCWHFFITKEIYSKGKCAVLKLCHHETKLTYSPFKYFNFVSASLIITLPILVIPKPNNYKS